MKVKLVKESLNEGMSDYSLNQFKQNIYDQLVVDMEFDSSRVDSVLDNPDIQYELEMLASEAGHSPSALSDGVDLVLSLLESVNESLNETSLADMYLEMGTRFRTSPEMERKARNTGIDTDNNPEFRELVTGWEQGMYDEDPGYVWNKILNMIRFNESLNEAWDDYMHERPYINDDYENGIIDTLETDISGEEAYEAMTLPGAKELVIDGYENGIDPEVVGQKILSLFYRAYPANESLNEKKRGRDPEGHKLGSKRSHYDKEGFVKNPWQKSGKENPDYDHWERLKSTPEESDKNMWLVKLQNDLKQNKYNLKKAGLYRGVLAEQIDLLLDILKEDFDMNESLNEYASGSLDLNGKKI